MDLTLRPASDGGGTTPCGAGSGGAALGLFTDLYEITMAEGFWRSGLGEMETCFTSFFRENPCEGGFSLVCGTGEIADLVERFRFDDDDISFLAGLKTPVEGRPMFGGEFLDWLSAWRPRVTVDAIREGELAFPREPVVRVTGPVIDCQLLEAPLLNVVNFETLVATKAARVCLAAAGRPVAEFGLRRAQGPDGALSASRAAYVGGCSSTSNVLAARRFGIPASGTHAHSWVMAFPDELSAFRAYAEASPYNCTLLVDTFDVVGGLRNAIVVGREMEARGHRLGGVRIDSGDLCALSIRARSMLDEAGLPYVKVIVSNDLDENLIQSLLAQGATVDGFGVGTKLVTCFDQPALSGVYKMSAKRMPGCGWTPVLKVSEQVYKRTIPGVQDLRRYCDGSGAPAADMICDASFPRETAPTIVDVNDPLLTRTLEGLGFREMLAPVVAGGERVAGPEDLAAVRDRSRESLERLDPSCKRFLNPQVYPVGIEQGLSALRREMIAAARSNLQDATWR